MAFPRLADHVRARQHITDARVVVILHDTKTEQVAELERATWRVLACADGTRDIEGIAAAASRLGLSVTAASIESLVAELGERGMIALGPPKELPDMVEPAPRGEGWDPRRPIVELPGTRWACDGRGSCCSMFGTVLMTPRDVHRAVATWPSFELADIPIERLMMPERGSAPCAIKVPSLRNGACAFLDEEGWCGIHSRGGHEAKPLGCQQFPVRYCDDGREIRATLVPECACVLVEPEGASESIVGEHREAEDLSSTVAVDEVPAEVELTASRTVPRQEFLEWFDDHPRDTWPEDLATWLWSKADELDERAQTPQSWMSRLEEHAQARLALESRWRDPADTSMLTLRWIVLAAATGQTLGPGEGRPAEIERRYLSLLFWGYAGVGKLPWSSCLRDRATRIWVARSMHELREAIPELRVNGYEHPLGMLEATIRGQGLTRYARTD